MLSVLIILWSVGVTLLIAEPRKATVRWLSALVFCGGAGALSAVFGDQLIPYLELQNYEPETLRLFVHIENVASLFSYYGLPYTYMMFAIDYHPIPAAARIRPWLPFLLLVPVAAFMLFLPPIHPIPWKAVFWWAFPLTVLGTVLLVTKRETLYHARRNHRYTVLAIAPAVCFAAVMNYLFPLFGYYEAWRYNTWAIVSAFLLFLIAIFQFGFLDMQFLLTRRKLDISIRAITSGTAILNHAIKNDVGKMRLFSAKIRSMAQESGQKELLEDIKIIEASANHIQEMITRVKDQTQELELRMQSFDLAAVLEELERQSSLSWDGEKHQLILQLEADVQVEGDRAQITETIQNLVNNAFEAMPQGGTLTIRLYTAPKWTVIECKDTGSGMGKDQVKRALEPFYTTKTGSNRNFGLGLSYAYHVMKKHKGNLYLESKPGAGTMVTLSFPRKKVKHGSNQDLPAGG